MIEIYLMAERIWQRAIQRAMCDPFNVWNWYEVKKSGMKIEDSISLCPGHKEFIEEGYGLDKSETEA